MSKVILIEASPRDPSSAAVVAVRMAGGGTRGFTQLGRNDWQSGVADVPRFASELGYDEAGWTGGALPTTGAFLFWPSLPAALDELAGLYWNDAPVTIRVGDDEAIEPAYPIVSVGRIASVQQAGGALTLTLTDMATALSGAGVAEGDPEAAGRIKRRSFGAVWNVEARLFAKAYNIYEVGDLSRPLQAIDAVRDKGRAAVEARILDWQGSVAATLSALAGVEVPDGGTVLAPSIACLRWWTAPSGPLTVDLRGEVGNGYVETAPAIAERLASIAGVAVADVAAFAALRPELAGLHVATAETIAQA
jgi:hypothetical protein